MSPRPYGGHRFDGTGRVLRSAGWRFRFGPYYRREFQIRMSKFEKSRRLGFGFELEFVQGGTRIARTRGLGRCGVRVWPAPPLEDRSRRHCRAGPGARRRPL